MQASTLTLGIVMIALAVMAPAIAVNQGSSPTALSTFAALPMLLGGVAMVLRRPVSFWVAMGAAGITALSGLVGLLWHRQVGLPIQPLVVMVIGLYLCFRILIARRGLAPRAPRPMIADQLDEELDEEPREPPAT